MTSSPGAVRPILNGRLKAIRRRPSRTRCPNSRTSAIRSGIRPKVEIAPRDRTITLPDGVPELTLGWDAIYWATMYLRQPDGDRAGEHWDFVESQTRFILWWYSLTDNARWIYNHGVRRFSKGYGKSPFAAVMSLIELLAPVRFAGWCDNEGLCIGCRTDAGCVHVIGKRVGMPLVQIAATAQDQANVNTMRMVRALVPPKSRI